MQLRIRMLPSSGHHHIVQYVQIQKKKVLVNISYCGILFLWLLQWYKEVSVKLATRLLRILSTYYRSVYYERTFWYLRILPRNKWTNSFLVLFGKKPNSFDRFLEESLAWKKHYYFVWPLGINRWDFCTKKHIDHMNKMWKKIRLYLWFFSQLLDPVSKIIKLR